ncbi:hypothetical protein [Rhodococcus sp. MS16]|uniref:hypothetical protein n=1 Tax=Rhodococcus sp. MS16 TaxID=2579941 RepID=UPI001561F742|nr:hypothetical protein [Rhodococcus sp. MS16]
MPGITDQLFECQIRLRGAPADNHLSAVVVLEQQIKFFLEALDRAAPGWSGTSPD